MVTNTYHSLFNKILKEKRIPNNGKESITIILHKKRNNANIKTYRPITLLNLMFKLLTKMLTIRLTKKFDGYQSKEQSGFYFTGIYRLNRLRYVDNIVLITNKKEELFEIMKKLDAKAGKIGLNVNYSKTKIIANTSYTASSGLYID